MEETIEEKVKGFIETYPDKAREYVTEYEKYLENKCNLDAFENLETVACIFISFYSQTGEFLKYKELYNLIKKNL